MTEGQLSQTITFPPLDPVEVGAADFNLMATVNSGLPLTYSSSDETVATISTEGVVTVLAAGETDITVSQPGNGTYLAADPVTRTLTVNAEEVLSIADGDYSFNLFPVPFENKLYIETAEGKNLEIKIFTMHGKVIHAEINKQHNLYEIYTHGLNPGLYLVKINKRIFKVVKK